MDKQNKDNKRQTTKPNGIIRVTLSRVYEYDREMFPQDLASAFDLAEEQAAKDFFDDSWLGVIEADGAFSARVESVPRKLIA